MDKTQKATIRTLALLGLIYFIIFIFPNASTMGSDNPAVYLHKDEAVIYPPIERMLRFEGTLSNIWGNLIVYGDYHYGYPFFFLSALVLLPLRLIRGPEYINDLPLNFLILRQLINVLPMILTAGVLTWVQTHYKSLWKSVFIFLFILTIPAVVRSNMHWWHPDSLMMLSIALTFFFLDRDDFQLGKYFYFAAVACGMASAIKLYGFFFFLAIPFYLLVAWRRYNLDIKKILIASVLFVLVMVLTIVLANPFIFYGPPREEMLAIQRYKTVELAEGYSHEESIYYSLGPKYWRWTLNTSYGRPWRLQGLFLLLVFGCFFGRRKDLNRLILAWVIPIGIYVLWFVSPKPDHYLLPVMVPVASAVLALVNGVEPWLKEKYRWKRYAGWAMVAAFALFITPQIVFHLAQSYSLFMQFFV
jgi:hypothetical protein